MLAAAMFVWDRTTASTSLAGASAVNASAMTFAEAAGSQHNTGPHMTAVRPLADQ